MAHALVIPQQNMIARVVARCKADERIRAAMQYGSFTQGEGDAWSDIEFWLFVEDGALGGLDQEEWVARVHPLLAYFRNESGTGVAIFENLVRGEFHFASATQMGQIREWPLADERFDIGRMVALDRSGELRAHLESMARQPSGRYSVKRLQALQDGFLNWFLLGWSLLERGSWARALDALSTLHRYLLRLLRLVEQKADVHFLTPSKGLEQDLDAGEYGRFAETTAQLEESSLRAAYLAAWRWYKELAASLSRDYGTDQREGLLTVLDERVARAPGHRA